MVWQITSMATYVKQSAAGQIIEETRIAILPPRGLFHTSQRLCENISLFTTCLKVCCIKDVEFVRKKCSGYCPLRTKILQEILLQHFQIPMLQKNFLKKHSHSSQNHSYLKLSLIESDIRWANLITKPLSPYIFVFQSTDGKVFKTFPLSSVGQHNRPPGVSFLSSDAVVRLSTWTNACPVALGPSQCTRHSAQCTVY